MNEQQEEPKEPMKILVTGDPDKSRTKKLIKMMEAAGHTVVISAAVGGAFSGLSFREIYADETLGKLMKVSLATDAERERLREMTRVKTPRNRKERRTRAATKRRKKK